MHSQRGGEVHTWEAPIHKRFRAVDSRLEQDWHDIGGGQVPQCVVGHGEGSAEGILWQALRTSRSETCQTDRDRKICRGKGTRVHDDSGRYGHRPCRLYG